jgi:hypothetical protein
MKLAKIDKRWVTSSMQGPWIDTSTRTVYDVLLLMILKYEQW